MGWSYVDVGKDRYWLSEGDCRTVQELAAGVEEKSIDKKSFETFLDRNAVAKTKQTEFAFKHPMDQHFVAYAVPGSQVAEEQTPVEVSGS